jgi:histidinol dehydrogenase
VETMPRKEIIKTSLENRGIFILVNNLDEAAKVSNLNVLAQLDSILLQLHQDYFS